MNPQSAGKLILGAGAIFVLVLAGSQSTYTVEPGHRGVEVTLGKVSPACKDEGFGFKIPFITRVESMLIRQQTVEMDADCYSSDLQQIRISLKVLYSIPQSSVVSLYRDYAGNPFETVIKPRVAEAIKEVTATRTAEFIVQKREEIKSRSMEVARQKIGTILTLDDLVLENMNLSQILENAIEAKMVQEQEAARARFTKQQAEVEANTAVIKAKGEAESITLRGKALRENPSIIDLQIVERWDGITPLVIGPGISGADMLLPLGNLNTNTLSTHP